MKLVNNESMQTVMPFDAVLPFEQQTREHNKAFAAFSLYLSMGPTRTYHAVASQLGRSRALIYQWSSKYGWAARVAAHAAHLATLEREAIEAAAVEKGVEWNRMNEAIKIAEWQRHKKAIALADEAIKRWEADPEKSGTLEGIARMLELGTKLARMAAGMPTTVKEVNTTLNATVDVDWQTAIRKAYDVAPAPMIATPPAIDVTPRPAPEAKP